MSYLWVDPKTFKATPERIKLCSKRKDWNGCSKHGHGAKNGATYETEFRVRRRTGAALCLALPRRASMPQTALCASAASPSISPIRKQAEDRQAFLAREVDHRARNVLPCAVGAPP